MKRSLLAILVLAVGCGGHGKPAPESPAAAGSVAADLTSICEAAKTAASRDDFARAVDKGLTTEAGRKIFAAAGQAADADKNTTIQQGAIEVGVPDWDCEGPLSKLYGPQAAR